MSNEENVHGAQMLNVKNKFGSCANAHQIEINF